MDIKTMALYAAGGLAGLYGLYKLGSKKDQEAVTESVPVPIILGNQGPTFAADSGETGFASLAQNGLVFDGDNESDTADSQSNVALQIAQLQADIQKQQIGAQQSIANKVIDIFRTPELDNTDNGVNVDDQRVTAPAPTRKLSNQDIKIGVNAIRKLAKNANLKTKSGFNKAGTLIVDAAVKAGITSSRDVAMLVNRALGTSISSADVLQFQEQQQLSGLN